MSASYTAVLPIREQSVLFVSGRLRDERVRRGTRADRRKLSTFKQAILVLRGVAIWGALVGSSRGTAQDTS